MPKGNCTLKFYLHTGVQLKSHGYPIYVRITYKREKAYFATGEYCQPEQWNEETQRPLRNPRAKEKLAYIENQIFEVKRKLEYENRPISAKIIRDVYTGKAEEQEQKPLLLEYLDNYIARIAKLVEDYTEGTVRHYKTTYKHLHAYLASVNQTKITLDQFDLIHIKRLDEFLLTTPNDQLGKPMGRNSANKYHTKLKTVLLEALRDDLIRKNPYRDFPLKNKKVKRSYLSQEELERLRKHDLGGNLSLDRARDIFLWSCYTGLRYGDAINLTSRDIIQDATGQYWLILDQQQKTGEDLGIPLPDKALAIYQKYQSHREVTGKILPTLTNQKVNAYLKVIADLAGIDKQLTHHVARHTFATTIMLDNGISLKEVSRFLGHTSIKSTEIYAKITREKMLEAVNKINNRI